MYTLRDTLDTPQIFCICNQIYIVPLPPSLDNTLAIYQIFTIPPQLQAPPNYNEPIQNLHPSNSGNHYSL